MEEDKKKRGRPLKDGAMRKRVETLMTEEDYRALVQISKNTGTSISDLMRRGAKIIVAGASDLYNSRNKTDDYDDYFDDIVDDFDDDFD